MGMGAAMTALPSETGTTLITEKSPHDDSPRTLGDLLCAEKSGARIPESEWVELVLAIAAGDQSALQALFERSHRIVFTLIMRIIDSRETAEELTLDVFHDVWRRAPQYDAANGPVLGWIMNQARSRAIDRLRYEQRRKRVNPHPTELTAVPGANDGDDVLEFEEKRMRVRRAVAMLSSQEREVIEAAYFSQLTYAEVASRFSQPLGTVKTRIRTALRKLRQQLAVEGGRNEYALEWPWMRPGRNHLCVCAPRTCGGRNAGSRGSHRHLRGLPAGAGVTSPGHSFIGELAAGHVAAVSLALGPACVSHCAGGGRDARARGPAMVRTRMG